MSSLLDDWREHAYGQNANTQAGQVFWNNYFIIEKGIYEKILSEPDNIVRGTVEALAAKYDTDLRTMVGFLDGINDSLVEPNPIEEINKNTEVNLGFDKEKLYYNMVAAKAEWLYELEVWEKLLTKEVRSELYKEQKKSGTIIKGKKIGRNNPCPCGSGKKYKKCCGA